MILTPTSTLRIPAEDLTITPDSGDATLDAGAVPYAQATVEITLTNPDLVERIDPQDTRRAFLDAAVGDTPRTFDLALLSRQVSHDRRTIRLSLGSDEALLQQYRPLTDNTAPFALQPDLRSIVNYVLDRAIPGAELDEWEDATIWVNYVRNPSGAAGSVAYWQAGSNSNAPAAVATNGPDNGPYVYVQQNAANNFRVSQLLPAITVTSGDTLRYEFDLRVWGPATFTLEFNTTAGVWSGSAPITHPGGEWRRFRGEIPATASGVIERVQLYAASQPTAPFAWDIANLRLVHADNERSGDLLTWGAGVSAWEFLEPLAASVGLKLFCDEQRVWRLINPEQYSRPGRITITPDNATEGTDTITTIDPSLTCTGVVVRYQWRDSAGVERETIDSVGTPERVYPLTLNRAYPGPGVAAAILANRHGKGRIQDVTALADLTATPGMEAAIRLPGTIDQIGTLTAVTWNLTDATMRVQSTGLTDAAASSWLGWPPGQAWEDLEPGRAWLDLPEQET